MYTYLHVHLVELLMWEYTNAWWCTKDHDKTNENLDEFGEWKSPTNRMSPFQEKWEIITIDDHIPCQAVGAPKLERWSRMLHGDIFPGKPVCLVGW